MAGVLFSPITQPVLTSLANGFVLDVGVDDCLRHLSMGEAVPYLLGVVALCVVNYLLFTFTTSFYLGYLLLALYIGWAVYRYLFKTRSKYICGNCGRQIKSKGKCPYCGVVNE